MINNKLERYNRITLSVIFIILLCLIIGIIKLSAKREITDRETADRYSINTPVTIIDKGICSSADRIGIPDYLTETEDVTTEPPDTNEPVVEYDFSKQVPLAPEVGNDYFSDALFIGDSRTVGLMTYGSIKCTWYAKVSLNINGALHTRFITNPQNSAEELTVVEAIAKNPVYKKVYICFGLNELGWPNPVTFANAYKYLIDQISALLPDADIYIQALIPVSKKVSETNKYGVTNENIRKYNSLLLELAEEKRVYYINVAEPFTDENVDMKSSLSSDGIHLSKQGIGQWVDYIKTHTAGDM